MPSQHQSKGEDTEPSNKKPMHGSWTTQSASSLCCGCVGRRLLLALLFPNERLQRGQRRAANTNLFRKNRSVGWEAFSTF